MCPLCRKLDMLDTVVGSASVGAELLNKKRFSTIYSAPGAKEKADSLDNS